MSSIRRSVKTVTGSVTVVSGDVVISDNSKGIVMTDNTDTEQRIKIVQDGDVPVIQIEGV